MAILARIRDALVAAYQGYEELLDRYARGFTGISESLDDRIQTIRSLPADDNAKKRELAAFFASSAGQQYSKDDRREAYDDLLGKSTNKELRG